jgi:hypothetical protein
MAVLSSKLVINLADHASAKAKRLQAQLAALNQTSKATSFGNTFAQQGRQVTRSVRKVTGNSGISGLGTAFGAAYFLKSQYEFEKALNETQAVARITDRKAFQPLRDRIVELAAEYPAMRKEIAKGTLEMVQAGMPLETVIATLEQTIKGSMASGESIKTVASGVTDIVFSMGLAFNTTKEQAKSFEYINNVLAASATSANDSYTGFLAGLSKAGPVARALGVDVELLAAAHGTLANAGIKGSRAGTALRTMLVRMVAPTKAARELMRGEGVNWGDFARLDIGKLKGNSLVDVIAESMGRDVGNLGDAFDRILNDKRLRNNVGKMGDTLVEMISSQLGIAKGDEDSMKQVNQVVREYLSSAASQLDLDAAMKALFSARGGKGASVKLWKELFGVRHIEKAATLIDQAASGKFKETLDKIRNNIANAVDIMAEIRMQGYVGLSIDCCPALTD